MKRFLTFPLLLWTLHLLPFQDALAAEKKFYSLSWKSDKAWLLSSGGETLLSMGVNAIGDQSYMAPNENYYHPIKNQFKGDKKAWRESVLSRLRKWNFNTIGGWSDEGLLGQKFPYTYMLYIARGNPWERILDSVFTEDFEKLVQENAKKALPYKEDPNLVGYFLDNEMPWWGEFGWKADGQKTLLEKYALGGVENSNKEALRSFLKQRYDGNIDLFDKAWDLHLRSFEEFAGPVTLKVRTKKQRADAEAWAGIVAERYFSVTVKALRRLDPHHLILGARFAGETPWSVVEACGKYCDVVSVNVYSKSGEVNKDLLDNFYAKTKKPILITEYSFSAMENQSGNPNTKGADVAVTTQKDRAEYFDRFTRQLLDLPYIVGLHWFQWADESPQGRFDGENQNYGLVDIQDKEYKLLTQAHTKINLSANTLHERSKVLLPQEFIPGAEADYRKAEVGSKVSAPRNFLRIDKTAHVDTWGDNGNGGKMRANTTTGVIVSEFETGTGWGCGESINCNVEPLVAWGTVDLRGHSFFIFEAFVPLGINFSVFMSEAGSAAPTLPTYDGLNGSDGESYQFPSFQGTGRWETYRVDLSDLERRAVWGNQKGNNILDLQALREVQLYLPGNQGAGKILVKSLEFRVK